MGDKKMAKPIKNMQPAQPAEVEIAKVKLYLASGKPVGAEDTDLAMSIPLDIVKEDNESYTAVAQSTNNNGTRREYWITRAEKFIKEGRQEVVVRDVHVASGNVQRQVVIVAEVVHVEEGLKVALTGVGSDKEDQRQPIAVADSIVTGGVEVCGRPFSRDITPAEPASDQVSGKSVGQATIPVIVDARGASPSVSVTDSVNKKGPTMSVGPTLLFGNTRTPDGVPGPADFCDKTDPDIRIADLDGSNGAPRRRTNSGSHDRVVPSGMTGAVAPTTGLQTVQTAVAKSNGRSNNGSGVVVTDAASGKYAGLHKANGAPATEPRGKDKAARVSYAGDEAIRVGTSGRGAGLSVTPKVGSTGSGFGPVTTRQGFGAGDTQPVFVSVAPPSVTPAFSGTRGVRVDVEAPLIAEVSSRKDDRGGNNGGHSSKEDQSDQQQPPQDGEVA